MQEPAENPCDLDALFAAAAGARERAYAPYSRFPVGAALRDEAGRIHVGCNVENAAYPLGACAEANAIAAMICAGGSRIRDVAILGALDAETPPCGGCRQRLAEFADARTRVHLRAGPTGPIRSFALSDLLPVAFGPRSLDREIPE
ncbi:MAG: cytidine deaminase [Salinarimonadaceae bacterium]|nr:MAG: cytidine deaminase [Salinarimonadaceae bacterium]